MLKRKIIEESGLLSASKLQCSGGSNQQQIKTEARQKIIDERKERNRISAAASRKRKDDEIVQLREQIKQLTQVNATLMNVIKMKNIPSPPSSDSLLYDLDNINHNNISTVPLPPLPPPPPLTQSSTSHTILNDHLDQQQLIDEISSSPDNSSCSFISLDNDIHNDDSLGLESFNQTINHNHHNQDNHLNGVSSPSFFSNSCEPAVFHKQ